MIDLHAHILPGVDDGPASLEESLAMVRMAAQAGTKEIVAAPHCSRKYPFQPALVQRRWEELQSLAGETIRIHRGCEVEITSEAVRAVLAAPARYTIRGFQYLLAEIPHDLGPAQAEELLAALLRAGLRVILAHPEVHPTLARQRRRLWKWLESGVLLQVSAAGLLGLRGEGAARTAFRLLKHGLVHFIASGGHDVQHRPPRLDMVRLRLMGTYPPDFVRTLLETHPEAVLSGQDLPPGALDAPFLRRHWFQIWR
ncbi:MAG: hypothetical protein NZR01_01235 [Bryobacteraceae bacterium]|nr:hypothetical protein [Bryobacteraceae bacterium]